LIIELFNQSRQMELRENDIKANFV
jgi:hypothetical protein